MKVGDRIVAIDSDPIAKFGDISDKVLMFPGKGLTVSIERDGRRIDLPVTVDDDVVQDKFGNKSRIGRLGVYSTPITYERVGPGRAVVLAAEHSVDLVRMMVVGIYQIVTGDRSVRDLGGPIKIAKVSGEQLSLGPIAFAELTALISINLAFINLLPIPALDGGHLAFYAAEAVRRKPASPRSQEWAFRTGIAFVLALMLFVTINDVASLFGR
jgi:regulator of sigma E protease